MAAGDLDLPRQRQHVRKEARLNEHARFDLDIQRCSGHALEGRRGFPIVSQLTSVSELPSPECPLWVTIPVRRLRIEPFRLVENVQGNLRPSSVYRKQGSVCGKPDVVR